MKKLLIFAIAAALGASASASAANPFSDVPAGHWAYAGVSRLAAAGIIEGYDDGSFGGDRLMTRYEMAQIVARAMAKGASVERLAAEFADELDTLGVRVANLEKKADNVKITGEVRFDYMSHDNGRYASESTIRSRIWLNGQVNDNWEYTAMLQNKQMLAHSDDGDEETQMKRVYVDGRIGGLAVHAGRWNEVTGSGAVLDSYIDGIKLSYGDRVKLYGIAAKAADNDAVDGALTEDSASRLYVAGIEAKIGVVDACFNYFSADDCEGEYLTGTAGAASGDKQIYNIGVSLDIARDLNLAYEYMWSDKKYNKEVSRDGFVATLAYKGADAAEAGSWGVHASYYDQPVNCVLSPTYDSNMFLDEGGYKGWSVGTDITLAKNIKLCVNYYDTEAKIGSEDDKVIYSELYFFF